MILKTFRKTLGAAALILSGTVLSLGSAPAAQAQTIGPAIARYEAGVICPSTGNDVPSLPFIARTLVVPAVQGMSFGVRALTTETVGPVAAQIVLTHPPFTVGGPTTQAFDLTLSPTQLAGFHYRFDGPQELALGRWNVSAIAGGVSLFSIDFDVIAPAVNDGLLRACGL